MYVDQSKDNRGRKAKIGGIAWFPNGRRGICGGYCSDCNGKIIWTMDEVALFARRFKWVINKRQSLGEKLFKHLGKKYAL